MKRISWEILLLSLALVACGGGGGSSSTTTNNGTSTPTTGSVTGVVLRSDNGAAVSGATVSTGAISTTTDATGNYTLSPVAPGSAVVTITANNFVLQSRQVTVVAGGTATANVPVVPAAATAPFDPSVGGTISVPGSTAQITVPGGIFKKCVSGANPASGLGTSRLTSVNPTLSSALMPGNYTAVAAGGTSPFESFGAIEISLNDSAGSALDLTGAQTATIRIPVMTRGTPTPTIPLMYFDPASGQWVQQGTATLQGTPPNQFYQGTVTRFCTVWNADQIYSSIQVTACVVDANNQPISGASIVADGQDYSSGTSASTDASGRAVISMKQGSSAQFTATSGSITSAPMSVSAAQSTGNLTLPCFQLGCFDGRYTSVTSGGGFTHTETNTVSGTTVNGVHTFISDDQLTSGSFVWTGTLNRTSASTATITGTGTINNFGSRPFTLANSGISVANGKFQMSWNGTDPVFGAIGGISLRASPPAGSCP